MDTNTLLVILTLGCGFAAAITNNKDTSNWLTFGAIIFGLVFLSSIK